MQKAGFLMTRLIDKEPLVFASEIVQVYLNIIFKASRSWLASVAEQDGLNLTCSLMAEDIFYLSDIAHFHLLYEPRHKKTGFLHMRKQRRRSALR